MENCSAMKMNKILQKVITDIKKPETKEFRLYDSFFVNIKIKQN